MSKLDSIGTYIFEVLESGLTTTKNGFPQWVARLKAVQKYVETAEDMKHFNIEAPAYVDWSSFDEDIVAYMVMFKSKDEFSKETSMLNYEQLQLATGWNGTEFDSLINGKFVGKKLLGRVQEKKPYTNPDTGKTYEGGIEVGWIDAETASPERQLKTLDAAEVKGLAAKLKITKTVKPAAAPAKPATTKPAATKPTPAATPAPAPAAPAAPATPAAPKPPSKKKAAAPTPPPAEEQDGEQPPTLAAEVSQAEAWEYVTGHKGGNSDTVIEEAWMAACSEVLGDRDEDTATRQDWAKVRDTVIKDCALSK